MPQAVTKRLVRFAILTLLVTSVFGLANFQVAFAEQPLLSQSSVSGLAATAANSAPEQVRPNVVFFLVDDLGWTDLGTFGSSFYETPNVDQLAASGLKFTSAYAACPVCSPTRASILTGRYPVRYGITDYINPAGGNQPENWKRKTKLLPASYADRLPHDEVTLAEVLKEAGYSTFFAGKWHLGGENFYPTDQGFDINQGGLDRGGPYGGDKYFSPYGNANLEDGPKGEHLPDRLATETVKFIRENKDEPFFAYLSFYSVHTPLISRDDLRQKYLEKKKELGDVGEIWGVEGERKVRLVQEHAVYAGMVEAMDLAVGKVLNALDELDLADNTIVVFMSDNGGLSTSEGHPTSNLPLRAGKGWLYEGGIREPMIVRVPDMTEAGTVCDSPVTSVDFFPTLLELASIDLPKVELDGKSFVPLLQGKTLDRGAMYWHYPHYGNQGGSPGGAIREGNWKLVEWYEDGKVELYDLENDLSEQFDLSQAHPIRAKEMRTKLDQWRQETKAKMPTENPN